MQNQLHVKQTNNIHNNNNSNNNDDDNNSNNNNNDIWSCYKVHLFSAFEWIRWLSYNDYFFKIEIINLDWVLGWEPSGWIDE